MEAAIVLWIVIIGTLLWFGDFADSGRQDRIISRLDKLNENLVKINDALAKLINKE